MTQSILSDQLLIGPHISIAGGVHKALQRGCAIGATTLQLFTSNQKQWSGHQFTQGELDLWEAHLVTSGITHIMSHSSYLINLGSDKPALLAKSQQAFREEVERCLALGLTYLNFHPGAATGDSEENCLNRIVASLLALAPLLEKKTIRLLLEMTAGQGTSVGHKFEHLSYIIQNVKDSIPIGVCIDTCHIFAAGYDIRDVPSWEATLQAFDQIVGLDYLYAFHVNDSRYPLGARKDRHANLGQGAIGMTCFEIMMQHPQLRTIPKYLETPNGDTMWKEEIAWLKNCGVIVA